LLLRFLPWVCSASSSAGDSSCLCHAPIKTILKHGIG
jgi:hypothetical protein